MNRGNPPAHEHALKQATRKVRLATRRLAQAKAQRDRAIRESKETLPRRRVAELTEMTPGRVQQIVDAPDS